VKFFAAVWAVNQVESSALDELHVLLVFNPELFVDIYFELYATAVAEGYRLLHDSDIDIRIPRDKLC
jgi:hypothetical protein